VDPETKKNHEHSGAARQPADLHCCRP
jgi:hypothetical protein